MGAGGMGLSSCWLDTNSVSYHKMGRAKVVGWLLPSVVTREGGWENKISLPNRAACSQGDQPQERLLFQGLDSVKGRKCELVAALVLVVNTDGSCC